MVLNVNTGKRLLVQEIWDRLVWLVDSFPGALAREDGADVTVRIPTAPGVFSFIAFEAEPDALFTQVRRLSVSTLVATATPLSDAAATFLGDANAASFGGSWQRFVNGDVGVVGSFLVHDASAGSLAELLPQFLALQVQDALEVGLPPGGQPFLDADGEAPAAQQVWLREVFVGQLIELLTWRSAHHDGQRFIVSSVDDASAELLVPPFIGDPLRKDSGDVVDAALPLTIARTSHPRRGMGTLLQVPLGLAAQGDIAVYAGSPWAHNLGRWHGTALGSLLEWSGSDGATQVIYRAFVPDLLLSVLSPTPALDRLVDVALGLVNCAGAATVAMASLAAGEGPDDVEPGLRRDKRVAQLRAAVPVTAQTDGLVDVSGPVVEVGAALLDRLAIDQLGIYTAAHAVGSDAFVWLPTPFTQRVSALPVRASRYLEVSVVRVGTRLGVSEPADADAVARRCVELAPGAAMAALVLSDDGTVDLVSTIVVHEGVWWHRSSLVSVIAALHTNLAGPLASALEDAGTRPSRHAGFEDIVVDEPDAIVDVVPNLLDTHRGRIPDPQSLIVQATQSLRVRAGARQLEGRAGPNAVLPLKLLTGAGGFDPTLGEVAVFLDPVDHPQAGPCVSVLLHPGFAATMAETELPAFAAHLTNEAHANPHGAFAPAWEVDRQSLVATMTVPCLALAQLTTPGVTFVQQGELLLQAVDATVAAVAAAVERYPSQFPGFDRSQLHLRDGRGTPTVDHLEGFALWAPAANVRCLAVLIEDGTPQRWSTTVLPLEGVAALATWLDNGAPNRFAMDGMPLVAESRGEEGIHMWLPHGVERQIPPQHRTVFAAMLRHPEAPALGTSEGPTVVTPLDIWGDDAAVGLLLPPAPNVVSAFAREGSCDGVTAITDKSVWLRFRSRAGTVHVDLLHGLVEAMLQGADGARSIPVNITFPAFDPRVAATAPPEPTRIELSTSRLQDALDRVPSEGGQLA